MNQPRMQHYLPRFYLENFRDPRHFSKTGRSLIYVYEPGRRVRRSSARVEARQRHIYTLDRPDNRFAIEQSFSRMESIVAEILPKFTNRTYFPNDWEKEWMSAFVAAVLVRTPAALQYQRTVVGPAVKVLREKLRQDKADFAKFWASFSEVWPQQMGMEDAFAAFQQADESDVEPANAELLGMLNAWFLGVEVLRKSGWQIIHASKHESFVTSDYPVISGKPMGDQIAWGFSLGGEDSETYFPLTTKVCLRIGRRVQPGTAGMYSAGVRLVNGYLMQYADRFVFASYHSIKLAESFNSAHGKIKFGENALIPNLDAALNRVPNP